MTQQRLTDMQTQSTQENSHQRDPTTILHQCFQQSFFVEPPAHHSERDVAEQGEDDDETEIGGETGAVVGVEPAAVPAWREVVRGGEQ